jgi:hypothetical protein
MLVAPKLLRKLIACFWIDQGRQSINFQFLETINVTWCVLDWCRSNVILKCRCLTRKECSIDFIRNLPILMHTPKKIKIALTPYCTKKELY